ncbi:MAG TPA: LysR substrate-binding domain-containing protein, partial [Xanthobacteraceae bacterium]|nr:LysR substrate-binding domain-containing protein [Xanthobacteraceae bacterium]
MNFSPHAFSLRQLQYIVAVADLLSFHRAADECHVSQPSLSLQIAEVERVLAITIFERDPHRVALTAAGRDFVESARAVLHAADALAETARRCIDPFSGTLRIGVIPTISPYWLPELTPALRKAYPHLKVIWLEDKTHILVHALQSGSIDAALLALEAEIGDVEREVIAKDPFVLVAPAGNPLVAKNTPAKAAELRGATVMVLEDEHCFGKQALEFCFHGQAQNHQFRGTSLATIISMVAGGVGVTLLPTLAVRSEVRINNLRVRRFADTEAARTIGLVWRKKSSLAPALRKLATSMSQA